MGGAAANGRLPFWPVVLGYSGGTVERTMPNPYVDWKKAPKTARW